MDATLTFALLIGMLLLGAPIAYSLLVSGVIGVWLLLDSQEAATSYLASAPLTTVSSYALVSVPLFILLAHLVSASRISDELYDAVEVWTSRLRGGLAYATIGTAGVFGALSGSSIASATSISSIAAPAMRKRGYSDVLSSGTIALGSTLSLLIPPSLMGVIYGIATDTSIGDLFLAGVVPGILLGALMLVTVWIWVRVRPQDAMATGSVPWSVRLATTARAWPGAALLILLFVALYSGFATVTELAGLSCLVALAFGLVMRRLTLRAIWESVRGAVEISVMIFMILVGGTVFGSFLALSRVPQNLVADLEEANLNRWVVIGLIVAIYFIVSMLMDETPLLLITLPFTFPIITHLGFDPVWFGVMSTMMVIMGSVFPPVGLIAFVVSRSSGIPIGRVYLGCCIFLIPVVVVTVLLCVFPDLALWLPGYVQSE